METLSNFFEFMYLMFGAVLREWFAWNHFFSHFLTQLNVSYPTMRSDCLYDVSKALRLLSKIERCKGILESVGDIQKAKISNKFRGACVFDLRKKTVKTKSCSRCITYSEYLEV